MKIYQVTDVKSKWSFRGLIYNVHWFSVALSPFVNDLWICGLCHGIFRFRFVGLTIVRVSHFRSLMSSIDPA